MSENDWTEKELQKSIGEMTAVTISVNKRIEGKQKILDLTSAEKLLKKASVISLGNCGCRTKLKKCDAPLDVCICLDQKAEDLIKQGDAEKVSVKQALDALKRSHTAGLVHLAFTEKGEKQPFIICSCCSCCCHALSALVRFNIPQAVTVSEHIALQNMGKCKNCGICVERCQFHARRLIDRKLVFNQAKCFGCGLCITVCPNEAISLVKRS
jgi:NAD-dependent dihydropyrimidine dehydrogenase PreA subunit